MSGDHRRDRLRRLAAEIRVTRPDLYPLLVPVLKDMGLVPQTA